ncbi:MAG: hypothetical protein QOG89_1052, partial [Thermomicrobiales bacterium]|nr:hypothetical protein [Thermomicrobiales bacterium]
MRFVSVTLGEEGTLAQIFVDARDRLGKQRSFGDHLEEVSWALGRQ